MTLRDAVSSTHGAGAGLGHRIIMLIALFLAYQQAGKYQDFSGGVQVLLFPAATVLFLYALLRYTLPALLRGGISWRGTFYPLGGLRKGAGK